MRRVLSLEIGIEKPYFKPGAALRETKNVPRVLILQEALGNGNIGWRASNLEGNGWQSRLVLRPWIGLS
jgi:hypothetical protein